VLGPFHGRAVRALGAALSPRGLAVYPPWTTRENDNIEPGELCIYTGFHASRVSSGKTRHGRIVVLHPTVFPPAPQDAGANHDNCVVFLPAYDSSQYALPWRRWADASGARLMHSSQGGTGLVANKNRGFLGTLIQK
jgi:hypothetical protein